MDLATQGNIESASEAASAAMTVASILNMVAGAVASSSLQELWGSISALQLTVHLPLNNTSFPMVVQILFQELIKVVTFDIVEQLGSLGVELEYEVSPTTAFNEGFDTLGYGSSEPIDTMGTVNFVFIIVIV